MKFLKNLLLSFVFAGVMALGTTSALIKGREIS